MTLTLTITYILAAAALTAAFLGLALYRARGNQKAREAVPVRGAVIVLAACAVTALVTGFTVTNVSAVNSAMHERADRPTTDIVAYMALTSNFDSNQPAADILDGQNKFVQDSRFSDDLSNGRQVTLKTKSGKPATLQLFGTSDGKINPVLTYDGKPLHGITEAFPDQPRNNSGYPQIIPMQPLPLQAS